MSTQIIFYSKIVMQSIGFKFFAKIMRGSYVFVFWEGIVLVLTLQATLRTMEVNIFQYLMWPVLHLAKNQIIKEAMTVTSIIVWKQSGQITLIVLTGQLNISLIRNKFSYLASRNSNNLDALLISETKLNVQYISYSSVFKELESKNLYNKQKCLFELNE